MLKSQGRVSSLKNLIYFDALDNEESLKQDAQSADITLYHISEVIQAGKNVRGQVEFERPSADTIAMFCYTSGTTGDPKAAKLSHNNFIATASSAKHGGFDVTHEDCYISYLPLAHSFEKILFSLSLVIGSKIGFYAGDVLKLTDDCQVLKPTLFPSVPRLYNKIYDKIQSRLRQLTGMKSYVANRAI